MRLPCRGSFPAADPLGKAQDPRLHGHLCCRGMGAGTSAGQQTPRESKDPNKRVSGPKYYNINGIWAL